MSIGENIKIKRLAIGLSQNELAAAVGVKQPTIAQYERGSKVPSMILGRDIARILQCTLDDLVGEES